MRDIGYIKNIQTETQVSKDIELEWRDVLSVGLCKTSSQITTERTWSKLCTHIRDLCPETNWLAVTEELDACDSKMITAIHVWLESLVATPEWPFPNMVTLMISGKGSPSFEIIFNKSVSKIPFCTPPKELSVMPCRSEHFSGWKLFLSDKIHLSQIGQA